MTGAPERGSIVAMFFSRTKAALLATVIGLLVAPTAGAHAAQPLRPALDRVVTAGAPGAMALSDGHEAASGVADLRTGRPLRPSDRIRIGSITKSFVAVVVLQLVGEHRLSLHDTVGRWLPGVLPVARDVTVRELLNHTSGLPDDTLTPIQALFAGDRDRIWTPAEILALVRDRPLRFAPGTGWAYSNTDYVLAALIAERASHDSLEHELRSRIIRPLQLHATSFPLRSGGTRGARGYSLVPGPDGTPLPGPLSDLTVYSPSFAWGSGNGVSDLRDVGRFYRALARGRLLSAPLLRAALDGVPTGRPGRRYGLGLNLWDGSSGTMIGHDGDILGFQVQARTTVDGRHQAVVAANVKLSPPAVDDALDAAMEVALPR